MMCEYDISSPVATTPPPLPRISPQTQRLNDTCYKCHKQGHWAQDCPNKTPNKSQPSINGSNVPVIHCSCGGGTCLVRTSGTDENPDKQFYCCPRQFNGCGFFAWCDEMRAPMCRCGAGACSINTMSEGPNAGQKYYACRIMKGHGACPFFEWVDSKVDTMIIEQEDGSKCNGSPESMPNSNQVFDTAYIDSGNQDDMSTENMERMEAESLVMNNSQVSPHISSPENCDPLGILALENEQSVNGDIVELDVGSWDPMINKALRVSCLMSQSEIHRRFWRQISAAADTSTRVIIYQILGLHVLGWWGKLAFPPSRCLTDLPPRPSFCGIFPSFDPIFVPKDMGSTLLLHNSSNTKLDNPSPQPSGKEAQPSSVLCESSGRKSPPSTVQVNGILEAYGQALLTALKSMDPLDHVAMSKVASATFTVLDNFLIDYTSLYNRVEDFICCASRLAKIKLSFENDLSSQELMERYNIEKDRFDDISQINAQAVDALTNSNTNLQSLREEASRIRSMLLEIERRIPSCEAETPKLKTRVVEISKHLLESTTSMQVASEALKLNQQKEEERSAAKAALEKARSELRL